MVRSMENDCSNRSTNISNNKKLSSKHSINLNFFLWLKSVKLSVLLFDHFRRKQKPIDSKCFFFLHFFISLCLFLAFVCASVWNSLNILMLTSLYNRRGKTSLYLQLNIRVKCTAIDCQNSISINAHQCLCLCVCKPVNLYL